MQLLTTSKSYLSQKKQNKKKTIPQGCPGGQPTGKQITSLYPIVKMVVTLCDVFQN